MPLLSSLGSFFQGLVGARSESLASLEPKGYTPGYSAPYYMDGGAGGDGSKWPYGLSTTGASPILNHWLLRQNARSAVHDTPAARALVERYADTVVDVGLKLEATPKAKTLGITPEQAEEWSSSVEEAFDSWAASKKSIRDETMNFYQAQRLVEVFQQRDNDYFVRLYYSSDRSLLNPLQLGFIDPNQIRGNAFTSTYGFPFNMDGIIRDSSGREKSYNIWVRQIDNQYKEVTVPAFGSKSKRRFMLHGFQPEYAGQGRGYSRLSHVLQEFENLTDFSSAQIKKAINQSSIMMYTKPSEDADASNPFEDISRLQAGPMVQSEIQEEAEVQTAVEDNVRYCPLPEATIATPGSVGVFNLMHGEDLKPFGETAPSESYNEFVNAFVSYLSASVSMPQEVLLMKFGKNYSASRGALILFWRVAQIWREELAADFLNPIYEMWLSGEIAAGRISAIGWSDPRMKQAWLSNNWIGSPMPNIDPDKTAKSDQRYVTMGAQTLDRVARNLNGSSGSANRAKLKREFEELTVAPWDAEGDDNSDLGGGDGE